MRSVLALVVSLCLASPVQAAPRAPAPVAFPLLAIEINDVYEDELAVARGLFDASLDLGDDVVLFKINSFGGSIFAGLDFIDHVTRAKKLHGVRVQCVVSYKAVSMGLAMLESEMCDERYAVPGAFFLGHNGSTSAKGTVEEIKEGAEMLAALNWALSEIIGGRMFIGPVGYRMKVARYAWSFGAAEALAVGAIDAIVPASSVPPAY